MSQLPLLPDIPPAESLPTIDVHDLREGWCDWPMDPCPVCGGRICWDNDESPNMAACVDCRRVFDVFDLVPTLPPVAELTEAAAGWLLYHTDYCEDAT